MTTPRRLPPMTVTGWNPNGRPYRGRSFTERVSAIVGRGKPIDTKEGEDYIIEQAKAGFTPPDSKTEVAAVMAEARDIIRSRSTKKRQPEAQTPKLSGGKQPARKRSNFVSETPEMKDLTRRLFSPQAPVTPASAPPKLGSSRRTQSATPPRLRPSQQQRTPSPYGTVIRAPTPMTEIQTNRLGQIIEPVSETIKSISMYDIAGDVKTEEKKAAVEQKKMMTGKVNDVAAGALDGVAGGSGRSRPSTDGKYDQDTGRFADSKGGESGDVWDDAAAKEAETEVGNQPTDNVGDGNDSENDENKHDAKQTDAETTQSQTPEGMGASASGAKDSAQQDQMISRAGKTPLSDHRQKASNRVSGAHHEGEVKRAKDNNVIGKDKDGKEIFGDAVTTNIAHDDSEATLRPQYGIAGAADVIPPGKEQLRSDLEFDLFSVVQPGFGEGVDNKLFLYEEAHDKAIRFAPPHYAPGVWLGPLNTIRPMPWQWQTVKTKGHIDRHEAKIVKRREAATQTIRQHGEGSAAAFGRDVPELPTKRSSSGLIRDNRSPFEPVIHNKHNWTPTHDPAGYLLNKRGFKRLYSAYRDPDAREVQRDNGGPTLRKRRALEVILP